MAMLIVPAAAVCIAEWQPSGMASGDGGAVTNTIVNNNDLNVDIYAGTITSGGETAIYIYCNPNSAEIGITF